MRMDAVSNAQLVLGNGPKSPQYKHPFSQKNSLRFHQDYLLHRVRPKRFFFWATTCSVKALPQVQGNEGNQEVVHVLA